MIDGLVADKDLVKAKNIRMKLFITDKVLKGAEEPYLLKGWELDKELKTQYRIKKAKPQEDQFENEVWLTFYRLGFPYMNRDKNFKFSFGKGLSQQVDVLAADDETVLFIECKYTYHKGKLTSFKKEIEAIAGQRNEIIRKVNSQGKKKKVKFIFATKNYKLSDSDRDRLDGYNIEYFDEDTLGYYNELANHLGKSSRFQLLGQLFKDQKIEGMKNKIPAIRGKMGNKTYYEFSIEPEKLLKMGYVLHRSNSNKVELPSYQRIIKKSRLNSVREFVNKGGFFPNSVVVNINTKKNKKLQFDLVKADYDSEISDIGVLHLPSLYRSIYIIDGQHRLYGYSDSDYLKKNTIPVVAFVNLSKPEQVKLFMEINENQKSVSKNLRNTLNADLLWESEDKNDQAKALGLRLAQLLGEVNESPLFGKFVFGEDKANEHTFLKIESVTEAIQRTKYINRYKKGELIDNGIFDKNDNEKTLEFLYNYLAAMFMILKEEMPIEWELGKEGVLLTNVGISGFIRIFYEILIHIEAKEAVKSISSTYQYLVELSQPYILAVCNYINNLEDEEKLRIKKLYGSGSKTAYQKRMQVVIHQNFPDFKPKGIEKDIIEFNKTFNDYGIEIIPKIKKRVRQIFEEIMQLQFGDNWTKQLPKNIYKAAVDRQSEKNYELGSLEDEYSMADVLTLDDYAVVATNQSNWRDFFEEQFSQPVNRKKRMPKEQKIGWLREMHKLATKDLSEYSITLEENELLESLEKWLLS
ncbi:DGQHR domain-containing protein [Enterococcus sp. DIV0125]|uniref:DGQHR domain-containing protein n=1 Tax=Enterococcus sp. DIV0125 TaxID=2774796 RepID=UPI003D2FB649